jgi:hypothetical protein
MVLQHIRVYQNVQLNAKYKIRRDTILHIFPPCRHNSITNQQEDVAYRPVLPFETVVYAKQTLDKSVKNMGGVRSTSGTDTNFSLQSNNVSALNMSEEAEWSIN